MPVIKSSKRILIGCKIILFYILSILIFATVAGFTKNLVYHNHISILITAFLTFILVFIFSKWDNLTLGDVGLKYDKSNLWRFFSGFGIGSIMVILQAIIVSQFADVKFYLSGNISIISMMGHLVLYFLIACREELVFRSYTLRRLAHITKPLIALFVITIIFILEHIIAGMSWKMSIIGSGFGGILFGIASLKTKGLALPIGLHFAWNFTQWLLGFKDNTGIWREVLTKGNASYAENIALLGYVIIMCISICGLLVYYKNTDDSNK